MNSRGDEPVGACVRFDNGVVGGNIYDFSNKMAGIKKLGLTGEAIYHIISKASIHVKQIYIFDDRVVVTFDGTNNTDEANRRCDKIARIVEQYFFSERHLEYVINIGEPLSKRA